LAAWHNHSGIFVYLTKKLTVGVTASDSRDDFRGAGRVAHFTASAPGRRKP